MSITLTTTVTLIDGDDDKILIETIDTINNNCPKCQCENGLIIMNRKDRPNSGISTIKMECVRCQWNMMKDIRN